VSPRCDRKRSFMTPCVIDDGAVAYGFAGEHDTRPICVGCGRGPEATKVAAPKEWDREVADYLKKSKRRR
jgi:hypothetical protein